MYNRHMGLEDITLSEISQMEKEKYYMISCNVDYN